MSHKLSLNGKWWLTECPIEEFPPEAAPGTPAKDAANVSSGLEKREDKELLAVMVPGSVMTALLKAGRIPDPYYRNQEAAVKEAFEKDYVFSRTFMVPEALLTEDLVELVFYGLDTLVKVSLNGEVVGVCDNMHRTFRLDVTQKLRPGENRLSLHFYSPLRYAAKRIATADVNFPAGGCLPGNNYLRKAHSMFGWDWGPQLPDMGIWRDVTLEAWSKARLTEVKTEQAHRDGEVLLTVEAPVGTLKSDISPWIKARLIDPDGQVLEAAGPAGEPLHIRVEEPRLWWPRGLGEQPLYQLTVRLYASEQETLSGAAVLDEKTLRLGLRTLKLKQDVDANGQGAEFAFCCNGVRFFATGANMIPEDSFLSRVTPERSRRLVQDAAFANFNMIRVWGGGYYPSDEFYNACDEAGILVWQDLMFACNVYELEPTFEETVKAEIRDNVRRLRHHASLALWCGNNEMEWGWHDWFSELTPSRDRANDYTVLFEYLMPRWLRELAPVTDYVPSSPSSNGWMPENPAKPFGRTLADYHPNDYRAGDTHFYEVWLEKAPLEEYRARRFRFLSEFSFQSLPSLKTLGPVTEPEDLILYSPVMKNRQKNSLGNELMEFYLEQTFRKPKDFPSLVYGTQLMQGYAMNYAIDHMRRSRPYSMGTLYWQLNDVWPGISWSSVDYNGRYKLLHYMVRRAYQPFTANILDQGPSMTVYVINETLAAQPYTLEYAVKTLENQVLEAGCVTGVSASMTSDSVLERDFSVLVAGQEARCYFVMRLLTDQGLLREEVAFFVKPKELALLPPQIEAAVEETNEAFVITLSSPVFCYGVFLELSRADGVFSDNAFSLTGESKQVYLRKETLSHSLSKEEVAAELTITSLRDTY